MLSLVFPPDGVSTAHLMGDLATDLQRCGHNVRVLTTSPHYTVDAASRAGQPMTSVIGKMLRRSSLNGVAVWHVTIPAKKGAIMARVAGWAWFHLAATIFGRTMRPRPRIILVPSPLLTLALVAWLINLGRDAVFVYNVQELYPDMAINSGHVRRPALIRALRWLEKFVYTRAAAVTTIGRTMQRRIQQRAPGRTVLVIPNFADAEMMRPLPRRNEFSAEHALHEHVVVSYAGNIGFLQGLEDVLAAAELLREYASIRFLVVGEGVRAGSFRSAVVERKLDHFVLVPHQPYERVPEIYAASDICLVPLISAVADEAIPSKVARIMACGRPVLALAPRSSDLADLVTSVDCGVVVEPGNPEELAAAIRRLAADEILRREMGERGRAFAAQHLSRPAVAAAYDRLVRDVTRRGRAAPVGADTSA